LKRRTSAIDSSVFAIYSLPAHNDVT